MARNNHVFDEEQLLDNVKAFSFPRLAGTEGERKAVGLTVEKFKEIGFKQQQIEKQPFEFSDFYSSTLIKLILIINLTFHLILALFFYINFLFTFIILLLMIIFLILVVRSLKHPETGFWGEYFGDTYSATNVFIKIPAKDLASEKTGDIIISAHLDSKSQTFKTVWRIIFYRTWLYSGIVLGGFYIAFIYNISSPIKIPEIILNLGFWIPTILISLSNVFLMFLNTHNRSPGALDNASGMSIVFELSRYYITHHLKNFNLWFLITSAEELGTMGSRNFVNKYENQFVKGRIFQINFDMISVSTYGENRNLVEYLKSYGILPRKKIAPVLCNYLEKAATEENVKIHGFHLSTGAHTDTVAFHLRGYSAVDMTTKYAAFWTHNEEDTPDKVDPKILKDACKISKKTISMLDNDYEILCKSEEMQCEEK